MRDLFVSDLFVIVCPACALAGGSFEELAEAEQLAGVHDDLLHRGRPTARVSGAVPDEDRPPGPGWPAGDPLAALAAETLSALGGAAGGWPR